MLAQGWKAISGRDVVRSHKPFKICWAPTMSLDRLQVELSRRSSQVLSTWVDGQCGKLMTVVGQQFITLTVHIVYKTRRLACGTASRGSVSGSGDLSVNLSVDILARSRSSSSLKITDRSFRYASLCLWSQIPLSLRQSHSGTSSSIPSPSTSPLFNSPVPSSITFSLFHSRLKSYLFHKSFPP